MVCNGYSQADLLVRQGDDWTCQVEVQYLDGSPADITGWTAQSQIRKGFADDNPDIVVDISATVVSPNINLYIPKAETVDMLGEYAWDLQVTDPAGMVTTLLSGVVNVMQEVTRL